MIPFILHAPKDKTIEVKKRTALPRVGVGGRYDSTNGIKEVWEGGTL